MENRGRVWGSMIAVILLVSIFDFISHMWGPGIQDWSTTHHTWNTVKSLQGWLRIVGLPLTLFLLYFERKGNPLGKYWVVYPFVRLIYDVGWMTYFGNPYPSWYIQDFGSFLLCMAPAFVIDSWGISLVRFHGPEGAKERPSRIELVIKIISLITALAGLIKSLIR
jgi:hypothetical protein